MYQTLQKSEERYSQLQKINEELSEEINEIANALSESESENEYENEQVAGLKLEIETQCMTILQLNNKSFYFENQVKQVTSNMENRIRTEQSQVRELELTIETRRKLIVKLQNRCLNFEDEIGRLNTKLHDSHINLSWMKEKEYTTQNKINGLKESLRKSECQLEVIREDSFHNSLAFVFFSVLFSCMFILALLPSKYCSQFVLSMRSYISSKFGEYIEPLMDKYLIVDGT